MAADPNGVQPLGYELEEAAILNATKDRRDDRCEQRADLEDGFSWYYANTSAMIMSPIGTRRGWFAVRFPLRSTAQQLVQFCLSRARLLHFGARATSAEDEPSGDPGRELDRNGPNLPKRSKV